MARILKVAGRRWRVPWGWCSRISRERILLGMPDIGRWDPGLSSIELRGRCTRVRAAGIYDLAMTRRVFLDTEWTAPPWSDRSELMWIGLADEEDRTWSAISADVDIDPSTNDFVAGVWKYISPDDRGRRRLRLRQVS